MSAQQGLRRRALQKRARLRVNRSAKEIIRRSVANIELDRGIERRKFDQIRLTKISYLRRGMIGQCLASQCFQILDRRNAKNPAGNVADRASLEYDAADLNLRR